MSARIKKLGLTGIAAVGLFAGAAGIAAAATNGGSSNSSATTAAVDVPEANDTPDGVDTDADHEGDEAAAYTSSITTSDAEGADDASEDAALAKLATVTSDQASAAASAAVPGTVNEVQLENVDGSVVYTVEIETTNGTVDVVIDAGNAAVLAQETDEADGDHEGHSDTDPAHEAASTTP